MNEIVRPYIGLATRPNVVDSLDRVLPTLAERVRLHRQDRSPTDTFLQRRKEVWEGGEKEEKGQLGEEEKRERGTRKSETEFDRDRTREKERKNKKAGRTDSLLVSESVETLREFLPVTTVS